MQTTGWINWPFKLGMQVKLRAFSLSGALSKIRGKWRQHREDGWYTGRIVIRGFVEITNGKYHQRARNHFVNNGLQALMWGMSSGINKGGSLYMNWAETPLDVQTMYLGSDTSAKTNPSMTQLVSPIGTAPGTAPNSFTSNFTTLTNGGQATFTATWNAGTVSGTVGELGLYAYYANGQYNAPSAPYRGDGNSYYDFIYGSQPLGLISRLSVADGDFSAFTINTQYPVAVAWTVQFVFA